MRKFLVKFLKIHFLQHTKAMYIHMYVRTLLSSTSLFKFCSMAENENLPRYFTTESSFVWYELLISTWFQREREKGIGTSSTINKFLASGSGIRVTLEHVAGVFEESRTGLHSLQCWRHVLLQDPVVRRMTSVITNLKICNSITITR